MPRVGSEWEMSALGESALLLTCENRISNPLIARLHRLREWLVARTQQGLTDIVPAFASVLIRFNSSLIGDQELRVLLLLGLHDTKQEADEHVLPIARHIIPVRYGGDDGPDLESLAALHQLSPAELVRLHSSRMYSVAFLGFLPGFAYLGTLPRKIVSPRLAVPRPRVAAGSVGLAGLQTGIYPFASPGGWQIIGRTGAQVWNPLSEKAALFSPADMVRFVPSQHDIETGHAQVKDLPVTNPILEVVEAHGYSTIQDMGRPGYAHLGVGTGGVFDAVAARRANTLVGNGDRGGVIEMVLGGPTLRALQNCTIALDGADFHCVAGTLPVPLRLSWFVRAGTVLRFSQTTRSARARAYLAVSGGFDIPTVLGSSSTSTLAGFGGYAGRPLRSGDVLSAHRSKVAPLQIAGRSWHAKLDDISRNVSYLRFVPFNGRQSALAVALRGFVSREWEMTTQSDRMGCRFRPTEGDSLPTRKTELVSFGVVPGAIQLPSSGLPVVLGVDCQTTGGYPLLGVVIGADMPVLAQLLPGSTVRFVPVSVKEARVALQKAEEEFVLGLPAAR